ncbi:MAG TPA: putative lipid II flippase FtsW [Planctomycetaceae bacterium]|nr:putative lipid II flippase FtsW [Planctomycetaceae bacterium]
MFLALVAVLLAFGILMVHSASITSWPTEFEQVYLSRHLAFVLVAVTAAAVCASLPSHFWSRGAPWVFWGTVFLLAVVLIPGVGTRVNGAQRWLRFGPLSLQPSELATIALPLMLCRLADSRRQRWQRFFAGTLPVVWPILVVVPLVLVEPDLGTAALLTLGATIALFVAGWPLRHLLLAAVLAVPAAGLLVAFRPYQVQRITGFLAAWSDAGEAPYQLTQSLVSLGEGGLFGVGLGKGWQKLSFLPEANTDFVFAVVGEELGLAGTLGLVAVWAGLFVAGLRLIAPLPRNSFASAAAFTLLVQLVLQAVVNMAVVTALVPPKGIPLPLISYGGSDLLAGLASIGIVLSLTRPHHAKCAVRPPASSVAV